MELSSQGHLQVAERGQVLGQACSILTAAAKALIPGVQGCMSVGGRMQAKHFMVRGFHRKVKSKLFL